jgi:hypothetical protein
MPRAFVTAALAMGWLLAGTEGAAAQTAEPARQIAGSYGYLYEHGVGGGPSATYPKGWFVTFDQRLTGRFAAVGEVGGSYRSNAGIETQSLYGFFGGARVRLFRLGMVRVFAQGLAGVERFSEPGFSEHGFAVQPGGGADIPLTHRLDVRVQGDYRAAHQEGVWIHEGRFGIGLSIGFGQ